MTIGLTREQLVRDAKDRTADSKISEDAKKKSAGSNSPHMDGNTVTKIIVSADSASGSAMKRRLSQRPSTSSIATSEKDVKHTTKSSDKTQKHIESEDIRTDVLLNEETKLFAELPDPNEENMSPDAYLHKLVNAVCGVDLEPKKATTLENFFVKVTEQQIAAYTLEAVSACRMNDLDALRKLHTEEGQMMNCFNRFGESLLTMACRRGFEEIVDYLLRLPEVDIRISDDGGRTVLHDACWNPSPQLNICGWILQRDPSLFFIADNRGCTPFQYARPEHWGIWRQFLIDNKDHLLGLTEKDVIANLSKV